MLSRSEKTERENQSSFCLPDFCSSSAPVVVQTNLSPGIDSKMPTQNQYAYLNFLMFLSRGCPWPSYLGKGTEKDAGEPVTQIFPTVRHFPNLIWNLMANISSQWCFSWQWWCSKTRIKPSPFQATQPFARFLLSVSSQRVCAVYEVHALRKCMCILSSF